MTSSIVASVGTAAAFLEKAPRYYDTARTVKWEREAAPR